jgi:hypothetical protein
MILRCYIVSSSSSWMLSVSVPVVVDLTIEIIMRTGRAPYPITLSPYPIVQWSESEISLLICFHGSPSRIRTDATNVKGWRPRPLDDGGLAVPTGFEPVFPA